MLARRRVVTAAVAVLLAAVAVSSASAQRPEGGRGGRGGRGGGFQMGPGQLLGLEQVQKELGITEEQKASLQKLNEESRASFAGGAGRGEDLSEEDRQKQREEREAARAEQRKKIDELLTQEQRDRLKQIGLQIRGDSALEDKEVADALGLSDEQRGKLEQVRDDRRSKQQEIFQSASGDRDQIREKMEALNKEMSDAVAAVLSSEQREKYEGMKGKKFEIDRSALRFGGRGGEGGRGGRGGRGGEGGGEGRVRPPRAEEN